MKLTHIKNLAELNELLPERVARENCVLVIAKESDAITLACPDVSFGALERQAIEFTLSSEFKWKSFPIDEIERAIELAFGVTKHIEGCTWKFNFECPKRWDELEETDDHLVRQCNKCCKPVFLCLDAAEVTQHAEAGECVCFRSENRQYLGDVMLQEFDSTPIDFSDDIETPEDTK